MLTILNNIADYIVIDGNGNGIICYVISLMNYYNS